MRHAWARGAVAVFAATTVLAAACGSDSDESQPAASGAETEDAGPPQRGGKVSYGVEADVGGGFCLPEAEHAISGWLVDMSVYDPLVYPNEDGELVPYLAESVEPNEDATEWTITLRDGITFHDGSELDAEAVKLNLDSYRGHETDLNPLLWAIVLQQIDDVRVEDPLTVVISTDGPWVSLPWFLFSTGRMGMMAPAQIEDRDRCARNLIGTGPFQLKGSWTPGTAIDLERNPDYWRADDDGEQLPYLDELTFVPVPEPSQRINQLEGGQLQAMHTSRPDDLGRLADQTDSFSLVSSVRGREVNYYMLNAGRPPFDDPLAREAFAAAVDLEAMSALRTQGTATLANGPFDTGVIGHLDELPVNEHDPDRARDLVEQVEADGGDFSVTFVVNPDTGTQAEAEILRQQVEDVGIEVSIERVDQPTEINRALAGDFDVLFWRMHPGEDPDTQYVWWRSGYPTNFNHFADPVIDEHLDEGRSTSDAEVRQEAYEAINRRFAEQQYNVWKWYTDWTVATSARVHGVLGPPLPDGSAPFPLLAGLHPTLGMWIEQ